MAKYPAVIIIDHSMVFLRENVSYTLQIRVVHM